MKYGKILLVDDEMAIRQGLSKLIDKNRMNWTVVGEAGNGMEALQKIDELQPHLVLTDIRMPVMDGLELASRIYEKHPEISVVILTGYKDFDYAKKAIKYNVVEFLLKPSAEEDIVKVLQQIFDKKSDEMMQGEIDAMKNRIIEESEIRSMIL